MRRKDREIKDPDLLKSIINSCDVLRMGLVDDGYAYIVPLNFAFEEIEGQMRFYFHSAKEGHKLDLLRENNNVSFEMDCQHVLQYLPEEGQCTMAYASIMGKGFADILSDEDTEGKKHALDLIMARYHNGEVPYYDPKVISMTCVYCLHVSEMSGKRRRLK